MVCVLSHVQLFAIPWTVAHQALLSMGFSRQESWSGLPFPSPRKTLFKTTLWLHLLARAILVPRPCIEPAPSELDGRVLTIGPFQGSSRRRYFWTAFLYFIRWKRLYICCIADGMNNTQKYREENKIPPNIPLQGVTVSCVGCSFHAFSFYQLL